MSRDVRNDARDLVPEYLLGVLPEQGRKDVETALSLALEGSSDDIASDLRHGASALATLADALPSLRLPSSGRSRLLATLSSPDRFRMFLPVLRRWFDLGEEDLRTVLAQIDAGTSWIDAPFPGVRYFHFQGGPAAVGKEAGCLILSPGARFPRHVHDGTERSMVLEGTLLLDGRAAHAGDVIETGAGTSHAFSAGPGQDLVIIVIHDGISFSA